MKILVVSHMFPSNFNEIGGIFVYEQVKELVRQGIEVKVISPVPWAPFPINRLKPKWQAYSRIPLMETMESVQVYYPRYLALPRGCLFEYSGRFMYRGIKDLIDSIYRSYKFDIIHAHVALPDGFAATMLNDRYQKPTVVTIHGQDVYSTFYKNPRCRKALKLVFNKTDAIITVSGKLKTILTDNLGFSEKIEVIHNGINPRNIGQPNEATTSCYADYRIILSVSYLIKRKACDFNLRAISSLVKKYPRLKYVIVGDGPEMDNLKRLASDLDITDFVEFIGILPNKKAMEYMAMADIFSLPSLNEAFGVVYIEAMLHGKPIIGCWGGGIEEVIRNKETGVLVKPRDIESLIDAMEFLLENPEKAKEIGLKAKKVVLENYTWAKNVQENIRVYKRILEVL